jgi:hypothetical protein
MERKCMAQVTRAQQTSALGEAGSTAQGACYTVTAIHSYIARPAGACTAAQSAQPVPACAVSSGGRRPWKCTIRR